MNIVHITSHLNIGGITSYLLGLSGALTARGHAVVVASGGGRLAPRLDALGVTHWRVPLATSAEFGPPVWLATHQLARRLQAHPVDLIHAHTRVGQVAAAILSRRLGVPYLTTWHGFFRRNLGRRLWPCTGALTIAISEPVRQHLLAVFRLPPERIRLIHHGIDVEDFSNGDEPSERARARQAQGIPDGVPVIGGIGRLAAWRVKGFDVLLSAAAQVRRQVPDVQVVLLGDGPAPPALQRQIESLDLTSCVRILPGAPDTRAALALMDVFVFPIRGTEGFGLSLIEAMAAGKPVVAARTGAVPEILEHGRSGWLVDPEHMASLAEGITRLLRDAALAAQLGRQARERARERFSLSRMIDQVEAVYREVLAA